MTVIGATQFLSIAHSTPDRYISHQKGSN